MRIEDLILDGDIVKHVHMISFVHGGKRLECVYADGNLNVATVTNSAGPARGSIKYLTKEERDSIVDLVRDKIGEAPVISY